MAKKIKNAKLTKNNNQKSQSNHKTAFNNFAKQVQIAKEKKIEKMKDTKQRLVSNKKNNKVIRLPNSKFMKKINKFSLLQEGEEMREGLTHRGKSFKDIKHFNDMDFEEDNLSELYENQDQLNFAGFDEEHGENEEDRKPKTKNQIYKEIIEKSKQHKKDRQDQYEQNFNTAVELDEQFGEIVSKLKFRSQQTKLRDKLASKGKKQSLEYDRLMNELKDDERVVANKVVENVTKGNQKMKKKKNEQINLLMKNKNGEEDQDIRGWVNNICEEDDESDQEDEIDDVQLSSGDQDQDEDDQDDDEEDDGEDEDNEDNEEDDDLESEDDDLEEDDDDEIDNNEDDEENFEENFSDDDDDLQIVEEESSSEIPVAKSAKNKRKKKKFN